LIGSGIRVHYGSGIGCITVNETDVYVKRCHNPKQIEKRIINDTIARPPLAEMYSEEETRAPTLLAVRNNRRNLYEKRR
jgi:hypothetical protein